LEIEYMKEKRLFNNEKFVLLTKPSWDNQTENELDYLAIVKNEELRSIRSIKDVGLLKEILLISKDEICKKHTNVQKNQIISSIHYHPSFWHFHVHFTHTNIYKSDIKCIILEDAIENLNKNSNYYEEANINVVIGKNDPKYEIYLLDNNDNLEINEINDIKK
jgi:m7GpppX diphosphatase